MDDILIQKLQERFSEIEKLRLLSASNQEFKRWHRATQLTLEQTDTNSASSFKRIRFTPHFTIEGDELESASRCYLDGLSEAESLLGAFIDTFCGIDITNKNETPSANSKSAQPSISIVNNISQNQNQSQSVSISIKLSDYDKQTQEKLKELAREIRKPNNRGKVIPIVKWLADKGIDALIALLPSMIKFE